MFLNSYLNSNNQNKDLINNFYKSTVKISRNHFFYRKLLVPDTFDGRFDMLALFSILLIYPLSKSGSKGVELSQMFFDKIFLDLDLTLRELGAGDTGVHLKIKNMVSSYMGRQKMYCVCMENNDFTSFKKSIINNVYRNVNDFGNSPQILTEYCQKVYLFLNKKNLDYFLSNKFHFPKI